jgi:hypothetical protein
VNRAKRLMIPRPDLDVPEVRAAEFPGIGLTMIKKRKGIRNEHKAIRIKVSAGEL